MTSPNSFISSNKSRRSPMWSPRSIRNRWNSTYASNERQTYREGEVAVANREGREEIKVAGIPEPISHYCPVVRAGRMVFISGMEPKDEHGNAVGKGDVTAQARQVHEN